jgi:pteridine reductase
MEKVILITGAARRIGAEIARLLHQNNYKLIIHYRKSKAAAEILAAELNQIRPNSAVLLQAEFNSAFSAADFVADAIQFWGRVDGLINNASDFYPTPLGETSSGQWEDLFNSNLKIPFFLSQAIAPWLAKSQGCIVNIVDIHAYKPLKNYSVYSIAKAGLHMMTKSLARELGPAIRVNAIAPGSILWPENKNELDTELKQQLIERTILKRQGSPNDIAKTVLFLVRDADYMTGQTLVVDGGQVFT